jgi:uncharacterized protein (DUF433 family)
MGRYEMARVDVGEHMVIDPEIAHGRLTFKGTRVLVSTVLAYLAKGASLDTIARSWPQIPREAVQEAIRLACDSLHLRYARELDAADDEARELWDASFGTTTVQHKADARTRRRAELEVEFADT